MNKVICPKCSAVHKICNNIVDKNKGKIIAFSCKKCKYKMFVRINKYEK